MEKFLGKSAADKTEHRTPLRYKYQNRPQFPQYLTKSAIFPAICGILPRNFFRDISEMSPQVSGRTELIPVLLSVMKHFYFVYHGVE